jgi:hypothetical protein
MNPSEFEFIGFTSTIYPILLFILFVIALVLAAFTYGRYKSIPKTFRFILISIRVLLITVLLVLLLNPIFELNRSVERKTILGVLVDNTASIGIVKGDWNGTEYIPELLTKINSKLSTNFELRFYIFDSDVYEVTSLDSITLDGSQTDLAEVLNWAVTQDVIDKFILISDGISTRGRDPLFTSISQRVPIHTISIGDTSQVVDISIQYVEYPDEIVINSDYTISAGIRNDGFDGQQARVSLLKDGNVVATEFVTFRSSQSLEQVNFSIRSEVESTIDFEITVQEFENEWSVENNTNSFTIRAVDNIITIHYYTYQFHPDVSIVKQVLSDYPEVRLVEFTWTGQSFLNGNYDTSNNEADLIVIHGLPAITATDELLRIRSLIAENSTVLFTIPGSNTSVSYQRVIPSTRRLSTNEVLQSTMIKRQIKPDESNSGHPILQLPPYNWSRSPVVDTWYDSKELTMQSTVLLRNRQSEAGDPVMTTSTIGNRRFTSLHFSGFQEWFLFGTDEERELIAQLIGNTITWSASDVDQSLLELNTNKTNYSNREDIIFNARVSKEDGSMENEANIELILIDEENNRRSFTMNLSLNGSYTFNLNGLAPGRYRYTGIATRNAYSIGEKAGSFTVGNVQQELLNTVRNDQLIEQIARNSNGLYSNYIDIDAFLVNIASQQSTSSELKTSFYHPNRSPFWFIIALILLTAEWAIRRIYFLP